MQPPEPEARITPSFPTAHNETREVDFEYAYRTFWRDLYLRARRRGHDHEDARDFTQDFFLAAHEHHYLTHFDPAISGLSGFMHMLFHRFLCRVERRRRAAKHGGGVHLLSLDSSQNHDRIHPALSYVDRPDWLCDRDWLRKLMNQIVPAVRHAETVGSGCAFPNRPDSQESADPDDTGTETSPSPQASAPASRMAVCRARRRARTDLRRTLLRESLALCDVMEACQYLVATGQV